MRLRSVGRVVDGERTLGMCSAWSPAQRLVRSTPTSRCSSPSCRKPGSSRWDDPTVDWSAFGAVVIRSTWDYHAHLEQFSDWARRVAEVTALWNPPQLIEWNVDKRYLLELAASGDPDRADADRGVPATNVRRATGTSS